MYSLSKFVTEDVFKLYVGIWNLVYPYCQHLRIRF